MQSKAESAWEIYTSLYTRRSLECEELELLNLV